MCDPQKKISKADLCEQQVTISVTDTNVCYGMWSSCLEMRKEAEREKAPPFEGV